MPEKCHAIVIGAHHRYGARFIMENKLIEVRAEYLPQLLSWIRRNAKNIASFQGNEFKHKSIDEHGVTHKEYNRDCFKTYAVCYYCGIPLSKFHWSRKPNNLGYEQEMMQWIKQPEAN